MRLGFPKEFSKNPLYRFPPVAHEVPIATVRDNVYVLTDGTMAAVFRVEGLQYDLAGDETIAHFAMQLRSVLNTLSPGVQIKLLHRITHNYRDLLEAHARELDGKNAFARYVAWDQQRRYWEMMERGELLRSDNLITLLYNPKVRWWEAANKLEALKSAITGHLDAKSSVVQRTLQAYQLALTKFEQAIDPIVNQMILVGLRPQRLRDRELYELAWEILNPRLSLYEPCPTIQKVDPRDPYAGLFSSGPLQKIAKKHPSVTVVAPVTEREQLCRSSWHVGENWVRIDQTYYGAIYVKTLPMYVYPGLALQLAGLPFECTICIDALMLSKQKVLEKMWAKARSDSSKADATFLESRPDPAKQKAAQEQEEAYQQMLAADQYPFQFRLVIVVAAPNPTVLNQRCQAVISILRNMESTQGVREYYGTKALIKSTWPFHPPVDFGARLTRTSIVASLMPIYSRWEGSKRPVTLFTDPMGRLVKHDPFPIDQLNRNKITCGQSGSGKSFMTQLADVQPHAARANTEILIIESGGSFELTTRLFGGVNLKLGPSCPYTINPFDLPPGFENMTPEEQEKELRYKYGFIKNLVLEMARIHDPEMQMVAENVVGTIVQRTYARTKTPRLRDFYQMLSEYTNPRDPAAEQLAGALLTRLANYVVTPSGEEGIYARYFDTYTNFDVDNPIICFDLIDVKNDDALLRPMIMVTLLGLIYNRIMSRDGKERLVVVDEAWALIKPPKGGGESPAGLAISLFWREGRKLGASSNMISQNYSDMVSDEIGKAVAGNSPIQHFLVHKKIKANEEAFRDAGFSETKRERIYNLTTRYGEYSEILIQEGDHEGVVRLPSAGIKYWLATTDPKDLDVRRRYWEKYVKGYNLDERAVIAILAEDYPGGVHAPHGKEMSDNEALLFADRWLDHFRRFSALVEAGKPIPPDFR